MSKRAFLEQRQQTVTDAEARGGRATAFKTAVLELRPAQNDLCDSWLPPQFGGRSAVRATIAFLTGFLVSTRVTDPVRHVLL